MNQHLFVCVTPRFISIWGVLGVAAAAFELPSCVPPSTLAKNAVFYFSGVRGRDLSPEEFMGLVAKLFPAKMPTAATSA